ncbi:hypothetical protein C8Q74DRAFT_569919 [Fomes fomentarius]|nr:hypothetical protein C8Q74DRAFT_569919 [Fomes fomentarius]
MLLRSSKRVKTNHVSMPVVSRVALTNTTTQIVTTQGTVGLRRGCLQDLPDIAVELQLEIFGQLDPQDLLNLSRTCKKFRSFFLHPNTKKLWDSAVRNAEGLPPRPPWMSVPGFIHLLFSPTCHNCGARNVRKVLWPLFVRSCGKCMDELTWGGNEAAERLEVLHPHVTRGQIREAFDRLFCVVSLDMSRLQDKQYNRVLKKDVEDMVKNWFVSIDVKSIGDDWRKYVDLRAVDTSMRYSYARKCERWYTQQEEAKAAARTALLQEIREQRFADIVACLRETGWEKEIDFLGTDGLEKMSRLPVVRRSVKLTEKEWEQVLAAIDTFLVETRTERLEKELDEVMKIRATELEAAIVAQYVQLPRSFIMDCRPRAVDLAQEPEIRALREAPTTDNVTRETFADVLPSIIARWEKKQKAELRKIIRPHLGIKRIPRSIDPLDLAIAVFYSRHHIRDDRSNMLRFPDLLGRDCMRHELGYGPAAQEPNSNDPWAYWIFNFRPDVPFDLGIFQSRRALSVGVKWMRNIVTALGLDPSRATFAELQGCDARVRCLECWRLWHEDRIYSWQAAFEHTVDYEPRGQYTQPGKSEHDRWEVVPEEDMDRVRDIELLEHGISSPSTIWSCSLCVEWEGYGKEVPEHMASEHDILEVDHLVDDGAIYPSTGICARPSIVLPPLEITWRVLIDAIEAEREHDKIHCA